MLGRKTVTAVVIIGLIFVLFGAGCTSTPNGLSKALSMQEIDEGIRKVVDLSNLKPSDAAKLKRLYDIGSDEIDGFILYIASSNLKADELLILKVKEGADLAKIKDKVAKRVDKQSTAFKDYLPEEYFLIQKHITRVKGDYLLLVISKNADKIAGAFDQILK